MSFIESFLVTLTSLFTESFGAMRNLLSKFGHVFGKNSKIPIIRMFHEASKSEN